MSSPLASTLTPEPCLVPDVVTDPLHVALVVAEALERCGLRYLVGGSLASSVSGEPRSTLHVDLVVEMTEDDVGPLVATLGDACVDEHAVRRAVRSKASVSLIHHDTSTKVDIFVLGGTPLDEEQMATGGGHGRDRARPAAVCLYARRHLAAEATLV